MIHEALTWTTAVLENLFFSGLFVGWANIEPILVKEGYFRESCFNASTPNNVTMVTKAAYYCESQQKKLSLVFALTSSIRLLCTLLVGPALDFFGTWVVRTVLVNIGVLALLATGGAKSWMLYITFPAIAISGFGLHVTNLQMSKMFKNNRSLYVSSISGALMSASLTFLIFSLLYDKYGVGFETLFTVYAVICAFLNLRTFLFTPKMRAPENISDGFTYGYKQLTCLKGTEIDSEKLLKNDDGDTKTDFKTFACSLLNITTLLSDTIQNYLNMVYVSTFNLFISTLFENEHKEVVKNTLFYSDMMGGTMFVAFLICLLYGAMANFYMSKLSPDRSVGEIKYCLVGLFIGYACVIGMQACMISSSTKLQWLSMALHIAGRALSSSASNTLLSVIFPAKIFGRLYCVLAVTRALVYLTIHPLHLFLNDVLNKNFVVFNSLLTVLTPLTLVQPLYVLYWLKNGKYETIE